MTKNNLERIKKAEREVGRYKNTEHEEFMEGADKRALNGEKDYLWTEILGFLGGVVYLSPMLFP